jgi:hypothetical protein
MLFCSPERTLASRLKRNPYHSVLIDLRSFHPKQTPRLTTLVPERKILVLLTITGRSERCINPLFDIQVSLEIWDKTRASENRT